MYLIALLGCSANDDIPSPLIGSVQPDHGAPGSVVEVHGDHFCQRPDDSEDPLCDPGGAVHFDTQPGITVTWSETLIATEVPSAPPGRVSVRVIVGGRASSSVGFVIE